MKARSEHRVPLSGPALALLSPLHELRVSEWVFPGQAKDKPLSNMSLDMLMRRTGAGDFTPHGFRSAFRDWAGFITSSYAGEVVPMHG